MKIKELLLKYWWIFPALLILLLTRQVWNYCFNFNKVVINNESTIPTTQLKVVWIGEKETLLSNLKKRMAPYDTMLIMENNEKVNEIPERCGNNSLLLYYHGIQLCKNSHFKTRAWKDYTYTFDLKNAGEDKVEVHWWLRGEKSSQGREVAGIRILE